MDSLRNVVAFALVLMLSSNPVARAETSGGVSRVPTEIRRELAERGSSFALVLLRESPATPYSGAESAADRLAVRLEASVGRPIVRYRYRSFPALAVEIPSVEVLEELERAPEVDKVEPDHRGHGALIQSTAFIRADLARALGYDGSGVTVAVLDSGIDTDHPSFAGAIVHEYHFLEQGTQVGPGAEDDHGHGTNVSGIIASQGVDAPEGIASGVKVIAIKVLDETNGGWLSDWAAGLDHLVTLLADGGDLATGVVNMSLVSDTTYSGSCDGQATTLYRACRAAKDRGIAIFAASGNDGLVDEMSAPACYSSVVAVGSVLDTAPDRMSSFTNRSEVLDLLAPGDMIVSTGMGGGTSSYRGTSQACPHAAAVACLVRQAKPSSTPDEIRSILVETGRTFSDARSGLEFPVLDARSALEAVLSPYVADLDCDVAGPVISAVWTPVAGVTHYHVVVVQDGALQWEEDLEGEASVFLWTASAAGDLELRIHPFGFGGMSGLESACNTRVVAFDRGDCNLDAAKNISDPAFLLAHLFTGGEAPGCAEACNANGDGALDISDAVRLLEWLFLGGTQPPDPFGSCGLGPVGPYLSCESSTCP